MLLMYCTYFSITIYLLTFLIFSNEANKIIFRQADFEKNLLGSVVSNNMFIIKTRELLIFTIIILQ